MKSLFSRVPPFFWGAALVLLPMVASALRAYFSLPLAQGDTLGPADPDSWLRLTLVRDWLSGGDWYSHAVARSDAPFGATISPWTRPLDLLIALLSQLSVLTEDLSLRLIHAALLVPVLAMAALLLGLNRVLRLVCPLPMAGFMACVLVALAVAMRNYFGTGNADHHSVLAALFVWALAGILAPAPSVRASCVSGVLFGLMLWISPEALTLIAMVYGWYGLCWLAGDRVRAAPLPHLSAMVSITVTLALVIERPVGQWLLPIYDTLSIVYVVMLCAVALAVELLYRFTPRTVAGRVLAALAAISSVGGGVYVLYPAMYQGPMAGVDPYIFTTFLPRITETQPLFSTTPLYCLAMLLQPALALLLLAVNWRKPDRLIGRPLCLQLGYLLLGTLGLYCLQQRFYYYFYPLVVLVLAPHLAALMAPEHADAASRWPARWLVHYPPPQQALRRLPLILTVIALPLALVLAAPTESTERSRRIDACLHTARQLIHGGGLVGALGPAPLTLFTSTDLGAEVLFFTPYRIIASNYHREGAGIRYVWEANTVTEPEALKRYLAARQVGALLLCPSVNAPAKSALEDIYDAGTPPVWLARVPLPAMPRTPLYEGVTHADPVLFRVK